METDAISFCASLPRQEAASLKKCKSERATRARNVCVDTTPACKSQNTHTHKARLSLGIRFEGNIHVMGHPWRVATIVIGATTQSSHTFASLQSVTHTRTHRSDITTASTARTPPSHPTPLRSQTDHVQGCIRIGQLKHGLSLLSSQGPLFSLLHTVPLPHIINCPCLPSLRHHRRFNNKW